MKNFLKRLWMRRWIRGFVWTIVTLVTLAFLVRQYLDWEGARRWANAQAMVAGEGESLDLHEIAADPVPDDRNFFAIPALKNLASSPSNRDDKSPLGLKWNRLLDAGLPSGWKAGPKPSLLQGASLGKAMDMKTWADWLRKEYSAPVPPDPGGPAKDVLAALSKNDGLIDELAAGLSRPESQWTPAWRTRALPDALFTIALPNYSVSQALIPMLCLRGAAAARAGDAAKAHESVLIAARLNQAYMQEPLLIGTLVGCGGATLINSAVWELCDAHAGTAEEFRTLQEVLSQFDFRAALLYAERGEMAGGANMMEYLKRPGDVASLASLGRDDEWMSRLLSAVRFMPDGWLDASAARITEWNLDYCIKPLRDQGLMEMRAKEMELNALIARRKTEVYWHLDELMADIAMPATLGVTSKVIYIQSVVNEAIAACALERYRIEHGSYPDTLEAANRPGEKSIPLDVVTGKPMGYRKTPDGMYALWCVSLSGTDHGGTRVLDAKNPGSTRFSDATYAGDWVWDFPAK